MNERNDLTEIFDAPGEMEEIRTEAALLRAGLRLGEIRKRLGLTQREVAERMGVTQARVSAIESAMVIDLKVDTLRSYARALDDQATVTLTVFGESVNLVA